ncbi:MAG: amino acid permease [Gammaproteobacteria bacterium]|nr:amino acid permease [Gammaproteobacteria bacterium]
MLPVSGRPTKQLTLLDAWSIIVGIVIGAGIYETTPLIAASLPHPGWLIGAWLFGGLISLVGALCYTELATRYPREGGDYVYLSKGFGKRTGFLFAWAGFWLIKPANIGAIAFIFARYAQEAWPLDLGGHEYLAWAISAIVVFTLINISGVQTGKWTQNLLTLAKVLGLLVIAVIGFMAAAPLAPVVEHTPRQSSDLYLAMILVLFTYGGWSSISYVAGEVLEPQKNILRSLLIGLGVVTLIYIAINMAFLHALGLEGLINSRSAASDVVYLSFGKAGALVISLLICITCLGNINGMIFTNARVYYAMGQEHRLYSWLGHWNHRFDSPVRSLALQAIITLALVIFMGSDDDAFARLVVFSAPLHWFFFLLAGVSLFIFRHREAGDKNYYRVPAWPWTPALFCLSTAFMLFASLSYAFSQRHPEAWVIIIMIVLGVLASFYDPVTPDRDR